MPATGLVGTQPVKAPRDGAIPAADCELFGSRSISVALASARSSSSRSSLRPRSELLSLSPVRGRLDAETVYTVGHGTRPLAELVEMLVEASVETLVDVRRFPGSRRNPQFNVRPLSDAFAAAGIVYHPAPALGGRLANEPGEERFDCIRVAAFRSYAARMNRPEWQQALAEVLALPTPCLMCAETLWTRCHRRLIAELLHARGFNVVHLMRPGRGEPHRQWEIAEARDGRLYLCQQLVA
jgi:Domain of unknown function DUF488